jgi:hypothetical protein
MEEKLLQIRVSLSRFIRPYHGPTATTRKKRLLDNGDQRKMLDEALKMTLIRL